MTFIKKLNKRYACKQMDGRKLPQEKINNILEAIRLAPTSRGMQAFKVFVIEDQKLKDKLFEIAVPQPQIPKASHVLVFASYLEINNKVVDDIVHLTQKSRPTLTEDHLSDLRESMISLVDEDRETNYQWIKRQVYIALGFGLAAAAVEEVDSVPMEGFDPEKLDELLNLKEQNLGSVVLLTLGYSDKETDYNAHLPKIRKDHDVLFEHL